VTAQWVHLASGETLVASHEGAWIQLSQPAPFPLSGAMPRSVLATTEATRHLLDGAIAAAEQAAARVDFPPLTEQRWALHLVDQWYTAHHSVALLPDAIKRYVSLERRDLARFARRKLEEEIGHDRLPLEDLRALGYDATAVVREVPPAFATHMLVEYARQCVFGPQPVRFFGYIYALERRVIRITPAMLRELDAILPQGVDARSGVRAHAVEFDRDHVDELVEFITGLPAKDRTEIVLACHETAAICCRAPRDEDDAHRQPRLSQFRYAASDLKTNGPRSKQ
jgi:hypothetical protein